MHDSFEHFLSKALNTFLWDRLAKIRSEQPALFGSVHEGVGCVDHVNVYFLMYVSRLS